MQRIYPVTEQTCIAHCGKPVLIFLNDGSEIYGTLSRVERGHLILNDLSAEVSSSFKKKLKKQAAKGKIKQQKATTQAGLPYGYPAFGFPPFGGFGFGAALAIELAAIAALFAFFI